MYSMDSTSIQQSRKKSHCKITQFASMSTTTRNKRLKKSHDRMIIPSVDTFTNQIHYFEKLIVPSEQFAVRLNEKVNGRSIHRAQKQYFVNDLIHLYGLDGDPLQYWMDYITFVESEKFKKFCVESTGISAKNELDLIMKRCTYSLLNHPKYANDERFVRIIVIYADNVPDAKEKEELFSLYHRHKVGVFTAMFWTSWAFIMEQHYDHKAANQLYVKGLEMGAVPRDILIERYKNFIHRARYYGIDVGDINLSDESNCITKSNVCCKKPMEKPQDGVKTNQPIRQKDSKVVFDHASSPSHSNISRKLSNSRILCPSDSRIFTIYETIEGAQKETKCSNSSKRDDSSVMTTRYQNESKLSNKCMSFEEMRARLHAYELVQNQQNMNFLQRRKPLKFLVRSFEETRAEVKAYNLIIGQEHNFNSCSSDTRGVDNRIDYTNEHEKNMKDASLKLIQRRDESSENEGRENEGAVITPFVTHIKSNLPRGFKGNLYCKMRVHFAKEEYLVMNRLGSGCFGTVVLCTNTSSKEKIALKVQKETDSLAWEFEILNKINFRLINCNMGSKFPNTKCLAFFRNGAMMGMTAASTTGMNLLDVVNVHKCDVPELLALYYTTRMLKHIETLHVSARVLHCDIKPDNWVLTTSDECIFDIMLVDFGRAIDIYDLKSGGFSGNIMVDGLQCGAMRSDDQWLYDLDCHGICVCSCTLLYGSYPEMVLDVISKSWRLKSPFRRYWKQRLWQNLFSCMLNIKYSICVDEYSIMLRQLRNKFEAYLNTNKIKKQLHSLLIQQENMLAQRKK